MATLPFLHRAQLVEQGGTPVPDLVVPCSIWPATSSSVSRAGIHHTHTGEADYDLRAALLVPNRSLVLDGKRYKIIEATPMDLVEHVVLLLKYTPAAG